MLNILHTILKGKSLSPLHVVLYGTEDRDACERESLSSASSTSNQEISCFVNQPRFRQVCFYCCVQIGSRSYFTSSALVSGKTWLASISKMLLTKTLGLKVR